MSAEYFPAVVLLNDPWLAVAKTLSAGNPGTDTEKGFGIPA